MELKVAILFSKSKCYRNIKFNFSISVLAKGTTILKNISIEPEVLDLIKFLKMEVLKFIQQEKDNKNIMELKN